MDPQLDNARLKSACDLAEVARAHCCRDVQETRMIREIEEFPADLSFHSLRDLKAFIERRIPGILCGATNDSRSAVSKKAVSGRGKGGSVEPLIERSGAADTRNAIRPCREACVSGNAGRQGKATLNGRKARDGPAAQHLAHQVRPALQEREVVDIAEIENVRTVPRGRPIFGLGVARILGRGTVVSE